MKLYFQPEKEESLQEIQSLLSENLPEDVQFSVEKIHPDSEMRVLSVNSKIPLHLAFITSLLLKHAPQVELNYTYTNYANSREFSEQLGEAQKELSEKIVKLKQLTSSKKVKLSILSPGLILEDMEKLFDGLQQFDFTFEETHFPSLKPIVQQEDLLTPTPIMHGSATQDTTLSTKETGSEKKPLASQEESVFFSPKPTHISSHSNLDSVEDLVNASSDAFTEDAQPASPPPIQDDFSSEDTTDEELSVVEDDGSTTLEQRPPEKFEFPLEEESPHIYSRSNHSSIDLTDASLSTLSKDSEQQAFEEVSWDKESISSKSSSHEQNGTSTPILENDTEFLHHSQSPHPWEMFEKYLDKQSSILLQTYAAHPIDALVYQAISNQLLKIAIYSETEGEEKKFQENLDREKKSLQDILEVLLPASIGAQQISEKAVYYANSEDLEPVEIEPEADVGQKVQIPEETASSIQSPNKEILKKLDAYIQNLEQYIQERKTDSKVRGQDFQIFRWYKAASRDINRKLAETLRTKLLLIRTALQSSDSETLEAAQKELQVLFNQKNIHQLRKGQGGSRFGSINSQALNDIIQSIRDSENPSSNHSFRK